MLNSPKENHRFPTKRPAHGPTATGGGAACPWHDVKHMLRSLGLRPTQQRLALGWLLFSKGRRHLTAEMLYEEALGEKINVSLATIYNTLNQLTNAGLLRQVAVDGSKTYFCNNTTEHHHFYLEDRHELVDIPESDVDINNLPAPPEGYEIAKIDLVIRLRRVGA